MTIDRNSYQNIPSRFEALVVQTSFLDAILHSKKSVAGTNRNLLTVRKRSKRAIIRGTLRPNPMFSGALTFAPAFTDSDNEEGTPWSEPLVKPEANKNYYVRCKIDQLQGDGPTHQLQGFQTVWYKPTGWTWEDNEGSTLYDEAFCNPLVITRRANAPSSPKRAGFKVVVTAVYRP